MLSVRPKSRTSACSDRETCWLDVGPCSGVVCSADEAVASAIERALYAGGTPLMMADMCASGTQNEPCENFLRSTISIVHDTNTLGATRAARDSAEFLTCDSAAATTGIDVNPETGECFAIKDVKCCAGEVPLDHPDDHPDWDHPPGPYVVQGGECDSIETASPGLPDTPAFENCACHALDCTVFMICPRLALCMQQIHRAFLCDHVASPQALGTNGSIPWAIPRQE